MGYFNPAQINPGFKFLSKMDVNGNEMHNLYRYLKRYSPLFMPKYGRAYQIKEHYTKFLCDRYGQVKYYYTPAVEYAVIEADIKKLMEEQFYPKKYEDLLNPLDVFI